MVGGCFQKSFAVKLPESQSEWMLVNENWCKSPHWSLPMQATGMGQGMARSSIIPWMVLLCKGVGAIMDFPKTTSGSWKVGKPCTASAALSKHRMQPLYYPKTLRFMITTICIMFFIKFPQLCHKFFSCSSKSLLNFTHSKHLWSCFPLINVWNTVRSELRLKLNPNSKLWCTFRCELRDSHSNMHIVSLMNTHAWTHTEACSTLQAVVWFLPHVGGFF